MRRQFYGFLLLAVLLSACRVGKGEKPLIGGTYDYPSGEVRVEDTGYIAESENSDEDTYPADEMQSELERMIPAPLTDRAEQILWRVGYATSYNRETRIPNWTAWLLKGEHTSGAHKRQGVKYPEQMRHYRLWNIQRKALYAATDMKYILTECRIRPWFVR